MLCYVMLCYVMLCYVMLCYVMLCYVMLCYVMLCYVMLCYVMLCYVMLCYVMLCYVLLYGCYTSIETINSCLGNINSKVIINIDITIQDKSCWSFSLARIPRAIDRESFMNVFDCEESVVKIRKM